MSDRKPSYEATVQVMRMVQLLERSHGRALPLNKLASTLGVHRRTVARWAKALEEGVDDERGGPLVRRERRGGEAWVQLGGKAPSVGGTVFQYAAVRLATGALAGDEGSLMADGAEDVLARLGGEGGWRAEAVLERVETAFHYLPFGPKDHRASEDTLDVLVRALLRQQRVVVHYAGASGGKAWTYRLDPLTLVLYRDGFYLLAMRHMTGRLAGESALRTYSVDRIRSVELLKAERFELPEGYTPESVFAEGLGIFEGYGPVEQLRLAFEPTAAVVARERRWPGLVGWSELDDGRAVMEVALPVTPEVVSWVVSWGAAVEVLGCASLREAVVEVLTGAIARYR